MQTEVCEILCSDIFSTMPFQPLLSIAVARHLSRDNAFPYFIFFFLVLNEIHWICQITDYHSEKIFVFSKGNYNLCEKMSNLYILYVLATSFTFFFKRQVSKLWLLYIYHDPTELTSNTNNFPGEEVSGSRWNSISSEGKRRSPNGIRQIRIYVWSKVNSILSS